VTRWVNSMSVFDVGERWITTPLHSGQWLPQPAPEPVARTNVAPQNDGDEVGQHAQAKRRRAGEGRRWESTAVCVIEVSGWNPPV